ncbi:MAG: helix-turn-helix transcriptional regulator [Armatimonadetes bacterium]|nr:helix-turn-helix transcriptional regulator [Armatimonadota bacterium]
MERGEGQTPLSNLSSRERQVLRLAAKGMTDAMICRCLGLAPCTIGTYWSRIRQKTGMPTRGALTAAYGREKGDRQLLRTVERVAAESVRKGAGRRLFQTLPLAALLFDEEGGLLASTHRAERLLSFWDDRDGPDQQRDLFDSVLGRVVAGKSPVSLVLLCPLKEGGKELRLVVTTVEDSRAVLVVSLP